MRVAMIGTGYVGLVSGACFADFGHQVCCVDKDASKIDGLNAGVMPIWEPGLEAIVKANAQRGRLTFTTDVAAGVGNAEAVFIAVGTPARRGDGHADLTFVFEAVRELAKFIKPGTVVVTKSTVPVGTGDRIEAILKEEGVTGVSVASNPEFLREGAAIADFKHPDRIVVGAEDDRAQDVLREIYRPLFLNRAPILITGRRTAELTKYAANAFLAVKISFINEIADLCEAVDADVQDVARGIGLDNRIGPKFLHAGPGYGGSCFPKDTVALLQTAEEAGVDQRIVRTTVEVNDDRKAQMVERVSRAFGGELSGKRVAVLGLAFKPNTDDMREAPSIPIVKGLLERGASVAALILPRMPMPPPTVPTRW
jgi:UDPglucose 6-dehydrogenase